MRLTVFGLIQSMSYELSLAFSLEMVGKSSTFDGTDYHIHGLQVREFARAGAEFFTGLSRNTQSKSYMLSLTECVRDF